MTLRATSLLFGSAAALLLTAGLAPARAQSSCQEDFQRLSAQRMGQIQKLNAIGKAGKGKMDPIAACPVARSLVGVETQMLNYMSKNKDWCSIPDSVLEQFKAARAKSQTFASQACGAAVKVKQMQAQQRDQAGNPAMQPQKLPSGPL
jgi:hypothetical protein